MSEEKNPPIKTSTEISASAEQVQTTATTADLTTKKSAEKGERSFKHLIKDILTVVIAAVVIAMLLKTFVVDSRLVPSGSMEPTIMTDDRVILLMFSYFFAEPQRGDVVVFTTAEQFDGNEDLLKRVIGLPGETIEIANGRVYIDGVMLVEDYIAEPPVYTVPPTLIPANSFFVLGDNRNRSQDSHAWNNPFVSGDDIRGRVVLRYWPLSSFGVVR